jgi:TPR repeat protein
VEEFCASKAYFYYNHLIFNFPNSKEFQLYLFRNGLMAMDLGFIKNDAKYIENAKTNFLKAIDLNHSSYYTILSLYNLAIIYSNEKNCQAAKKYISLLATANSELLNEYQKDYFEIKIKDIISKCLK